MSILAWLALASGWASAQTTDPAKIADFEKRFAAGKALEQAGKLDEARTVFEEIIAEAPDAKGSLLEAGRISFMLGEQAKPGDLTANGDLLKAGDYLEKLHALEPDFPDATEMLIQINQALKRDVKVEILIKEFGDLHDSGRVPDFSQSLYFVREQIHLDADDTVVFTQYFHYAQEPHIVLRAQVLDASGAVKRQLALFYDSKATEELQQKDPTLAHAEQFLLVEDVLKDGQVKQVDAYFQMFALPEYKKVRATMLAILGGAYKPVYSQPVDAAPQ
jgi:tetratricopeptide (TPR) repeat protein